MFWSFIALSFLTAGASVAAITSRNLVHATFWLALAFGGWAAFYFHLGAEFIGLVQLLVYVGAVAILIVFAVLLVGGGRLPEASVSRARPGAGLLFSIGLFLLLGSAIVADSDELGRQQRGTQELELKAIGELLAGEYVLALEGIALLLTAALIGAAVLAMPEEDEHHVSGGENQHTRPRRN